MCRICEKTTTDNQIFRFECNLPDLSGHSIPGSRPHQTLFLTLANVAELLDMILLSIFESPLHSDWGYKLLSTRAHIGEARSPDSICLVHL